MFGSNLSSLFVSYYSFKEIVNSYCLEEINNRISHWTKLKNDNFR